MKDKHNQHPIEQLLEGMKLPEFRYHPDPIGTGAFKISNGQTCECCEEETNVYYPKMYARKRVKCLCPDCIATGRAAEKFQGSFIDYAGLDMVTDEKKRKELFERTPGYVSWQGEMWQACCDDFCAFLGDVGTKELEEMGIADEVFERYEQQGGYQGAREYLRKGGSMAGYLFQCLHCKSYHLSVDMD